jgi:hypothetical protein
VLQVARTPIKDFGTGQSYTPIDLVIAADGCDFNTAFKFLSERLGFPIISPIISSAE